MSELSCPKCKSTEVIVARDTMSTRMCPNCGHSWLPEEKQSVGTQAFTEEYNGHPLFAIWHVDAEGNKTKNSPLISFGKVKAAEIMKHVEELKKFLEG